MENVNIERVVSAGLFVMHTGEFVERRLYIVNEKKSYVKYHKITKLVDDYKSWDAFYFN